MIGVTVRVNVKASALPGIILFGKPFSCIAREVVESRFVVIVRKAVRLESLFKLQKLGACLWHD